MLKDSIVNQSPSVNVYNACRLPVAKFVVCSFFFCALRTRFSITIARSHEHTKTRGQIIRFSQQNPTAALPELHIGISNCYIVFSERTTSNNTIWLLIPPFFSQSLRIGEMEDDLAKEVAAALLQGVVSRPQPRATRAERAAKSSVGDAPPSATSAPPTGRVAEPSSRGAASDLVSMYETCAPLVAGAAVGGMEDGRASACRSATSGSPSILHQYMASTQRRCADQSRAKGPGPAEDSVSDEVQHLMRLVESEKRKNRRLMGSLQALDHEVSLFRSRRQTFVTVVAFKLFNAKAGSEPRRGVYSAGESKPASMVGCDEHVEFFIVVDKSVAPKYLVRHRFNDFKKLHKILASGEFKIPTARSWADAKHCSLACDVDGRTTPWRGRGYYNEPPREAHGDDAESSDGDGNDSLLCLPSEERVARAHDAMPSLPNNERRPSARVGGILGRLQIGGRTGGKDKSRNVGHSSAASTSVQSAERTERTVRYASRVCDATGIPPEDLPFLERRSKDLEIYLRQLLAIELFADSDVMAAFLTPDHPLFSSGDVDNGAGKVSETTSDTSQRSVHNYLAPPLASQPGRISPGGDYIFPSCALAVLSGEPIPNLPVPNSDAHFPQASLAGASSPGITPMATPYMSRNLPSQQQASSLAQHHAQHMGGTWSGPLDIAASNALLRSSSRNDGHPQTTASLGTPSPTSLYCRPVSPFTRYFGDSAMPSGSSDYVNPHVTAFKNLVILSDEAQLLPMMLGGDAISLRRAHRAATQEPTPKVAPVDNYSRHLRGGPFRNSNFLLLLSALGFNQVPVYSSAAASASRLTQGAFPFEVDPAALYSGSIPSTRSMPSSASPIACANGRTE